MATEFWLVELEPDLAAHYTTREGVWLSIRRVSGVKSLVDLRAITLETLASVLMSDEEFRSAMGAVGKGNCSPYNYLRAYWKRVRQPRLLG